MSKWSDLLLDSRLVLHLPMQDNAASTDIVSYRGSHATYQGGATTATKTVTGPGRGYASALTFDGIADSASTVSAIDLSGTQQATLMYWARVRGSGNRGILEHSADFNAVSGAFRVNHSDTVWQCGLRVGGTYSIKTTPNPSPLDQWRHYAVTIDKSLASEEVKALYLDGALADSTQTIDSNDAGNLVSDILYLMARNNSSLWTPGDLAGVRIYNAVLTTAEITAVVAGPNQARILSPYLIGDAG